MFLVHVPLARAALESDCGSVAYFQGGAGSDCAVSAQRLTEQWRERSRVPTGSELDALFATAGRSGAPPSPPAASPLVAVSETRQVTEQLQALLRGLRAGAARNDPPGAELPDLPAEGQSVAFTGPDGEAVSFTTLSSGFRLAIGEGRGEGSGERAVVLVIEVGAERAVGNGLLLRDAEGRAWLAWRGGLLGTSLRKNATLWAQSRLQTVELNDPALDGHQRVALVARLDEDVSAQLAAFAGEVRRLRELLSAHEPRVVRPQLTELSNLEEDEQTRLIWSQLLGSGALPLDTAVSVAAQGLRDDGYVQYQRLRRDGALYQLLEERISRAARAGRVFDRPSAGHVRAIQPELGDFRREDWLDCLVNALPAGKVLDRSTAQRLLFNYAREVWGLSAQRLRSGGKAERALKSTLNSAIRRGILRRVGAAYLERMAPGEAAPVLEGASALDGTDAGPTGALHPEGTELSAGTVKTRVELGAVDAVDVAPGTTAQQDAASGTVTPAVGSLRRCCIFVEGWWASSSTFQIFSAGASSWCPLASR